MTSFYADRARETTGTTGTGTYSLLGARTGYQTFVAGVGDGGQCAYAISMGNDWEVGIGTVTDASPDTLSRDTILASSNGGAAVNWAAGTKDVYVTYPADLGMGTFVTTSLSNVLPNERSLTGTTKQIIVTDGGAGSTVVLSLSTTGLHIPSGAYWASETTQTPAGTTATIDLSVANHQTLDCSSASGGVTLTLTVPTGPSAGTLVIKQGATARDITWAASSGTCKWLGTEPTWSSDTNKYRVVSWRYWLTSPYVFLSATATD